MTDPDLILLKSKNSLQFTLLFSLDKTKPFRLNYIELIMNGLVAIVLQIMACDIFQL